MYQINSFENLFDPSHFKVTNSQKILIFVILNLVISNFYNFKLCYFELCNFELYNPIEEKKGLLLQTKEEEEEEMVFRSFFTFLHQFVTNRLQNLTTSFPSLNVGKGRENLRGRKEK